MPKYDFRKPRLFADAPLLAEGSLALDREQANYLGNVLRLKTGDEVLVFNGRDGEWCAAIAPGKRSDKLILIAQTRLQDTLPDMHLLFAPLKHARLDYMVQKAVEMGVSRLQPALTRFTQVTRVNVERMCANVVEAAEQCGILSLAEVGEPAPLERVLAMRPPERLLVFCDEAAPIADPVAALTAVEPGNGIDLVIGPEGGFADDERELLMRQPHVIRLALGPRILRADTAAVAALAVVQTALGDWAKS